MAKIARGVVKWFDEEEGRGFIMRDDGPDVYVDGAALASSLRTLAEGQPVEFELAPGPRGPHARNVRVLPR